MWITEGPVANKYTAEGMNTYNTAIRPFGNYILRLKPPCQHSFLESLAVFVPGKQYENLGICFRGCKHGKRERVRVVDSQPGDYR